MQIMPIHQQISATNSVIFKARNVSKAGEKVLKPLVVRDKDTICVIARKCVEDIEIATNMLLGKFGTRIKDLAKRPPRMVEAGIIMALENGKKFTGSITHIFHDPTSFYKEAKQITKYKDGKIQDFFIKGTDRSGFTYTVGL